MRILAITIITIILLASNTTVFVDNNIVHTDSEQAQDIFYDTELYLEDYMKGILSSPNVPITEQILDFVELVPTVHYKEYSVTTSADNGQYSKIPDFLHPKLSSLPICEDKTKYISYESKTNLTGKLKVQSIVLSFQKNNAKTNYKIKDASSSKILEAGSALPEPDNNTIMFITDLKTYYIPLQSDENSDYLTINVNKTNDNTYITTLDTINAKSINLIFSTDNEIINVDNTKLSNYNYIKELSIPPNILENTEITTIESTFPPIVEVTFSIPTNIMWEAYYPRNMTTRTINYTI